MRSRFISQDGMVVASAAATVTQIREVNKSEVMFGMTLGATANEDESKDGYGKREVQRGKRVFYTADEVKALRTLGLPSGLRLLGFKWCVM